MFEMIGYDMIGSSYIVEWELDICHTRRVQLVKAFCAHVQWERADLKLFCAAGNRFV
jgi:hypothetical protein